jgi:transcriptional regulator with XRE-family HTH domain
VLNGAVFRQRHCLKQVLGITQAQLSKYERGQNAPTLELLLKLKHFSGKSIDWIVTGEV